jgi:hypothetical protein
MTLAGRLLSIFTVADIEDCSPAQVRRRMKRGEYRWLREDKSKIKIIGDSVIERREKLAAATTAEPRPVGRYAKRAAESAEVEPTTT